MLDKKHEEQVNKLNEMYIKTTHKVALEKVMEQLEILKPHVTKENEEAIATALSKCFAAGTNFGKEFVTEMEKAVLD